MSSAGPSSQSASVSVAALIAEHTKDLKAQITAELRKELAVSTPDGAYYDSQFFTPPHTWMRADPDAGLMSTWQTYENMKKKLAKNDLAHEASSKPTDRLDWPMRFADLCFGEPEPTPTSLQSDHAAIEKDGLDVPTHEVRPSHNQPSWPDISEVDALKMQLQDLRAAHNKLLEVFMTLNHEHKKLKTSHKTTVKDMEDLKEAHVAEVAKHIKANSELEKINTQSFEEKELVIDELDVQIRKNMDLASEMKNLSKKAAELAAETLAVEHYATALCPPEFPHLQKREDPATLSGWSDAESSKIKNESLP